MRDLDSNDEQAAIVKPGCLARSFELQVLGEEMAAKAQAVADPGCDLL